MILLIITQQIYNNKHERTINCTLYTLNEQSGKRKTNLANALTIYI